MGRCASVLAAGLGLLALTGPAAASASPFSSSSLDVMAALAAAPANGLVAAYSMDQGSGTTLADLSGNSNTGTISGATWSATGRFGGALSFNGGSSIVNVPDSASLDLTTGLTEEAWVNPTGLGGTWRTVLFKEKPGGMSYDLYAHGTNTTNVPTAEIFVGGDRTVNGTATLPLNTWSHLAATYDGTTMRLYVNGSQVASRAQTGSRAVSTGALRIGRNTIYGEPFLGMIDEVRIYNRALTAAEVQGDMASAVGTVDSNPPSAP